MFTCDRKVIKSRKPHRCSWCYIVIPQGSSYWLIAGKHDDFWYAKMHTECHYAWKHTCDGEWMPGDFARGVGYYGEILMQPI